MSKSTNKHMDDEGNREDQQNLKRVRYNDNHEYQSFEPYSHNKSEDEELENLQHQIAKNALDINKIEHKYLHAAASKGHTKMVKMFIKNIVDVDGRAEDAMKSTALMLAVKKGHTETAKALIEAGANIEVRTEDPLKATALLLAARFGYAEITIDLIEAGANIEVRSQDSLKLTALLLAACFGHTETAKALMEAGANIEVRSEDPKKSTALMLASKNGHTEAAKALIEGGADIEARTEDKQKFTPLMLAAINGHTRIIKALTKGGANIEARTEDSQKLTPLMFASINGHTKIIKALIEGGADIEVRADTILKSTSLMLAASEGYTEAVKALIEGGANIEARTEDKQKFTSLMLAASKGRTEAVKALIEGGADIEARANDILKSTPLIIASYDGYTETVKALIKAGADIEVRADDSIKFTPLMLATSEGRIGVVKALIEGGADIDAWIEDKSKTSALVIAINYKHAEIAKVLLEKGCESINASDPKYLAFASDSMKNLVETAVNVHHLIHLNPHYEIEWTLLKTNKEFVFNVFHSLLVKNGINHNSFDKYESDLIKIYDKVMPDDLLAEFKTLIDIERKNFNEKLKIIEGSLIHYMHDISPMPYVAPEKKDYNQTLDLNNNTASISVIEESNKYNEFWNNPQNAKYKVAGSYLLELMQNKSDINIFALTEILLRANFLDEEILPNEEHTAHPLTEVKKSILQLKCNIVLPQNFKNELQKVITQYNEHKNNPFAKSVIYNNDKIKLLQQEVEKQTEEAQRQAQEMDAFKQSQASKISDLEGFVAALSKHVGFDSGSANNINHDLPHESNMSIMGEDILDNNHN